MAELSTCWDCGHRVSTAAKACPAPACKSPYPFGVKCKICSHRLAYKDRFDAGGRYSHPACVNRLLSIPTECCLCKASLPVKPMNGKRIRGYSMHDSSEAPEVCGSCGQPDPRRYLSCCAKCDLPLFKGNTYVVRKRPEVHYSEHYHPGCAPEVKSGIGCASLVSIAVLVLWTLLFS